MRIRVVSAAGVVAIVLGLAALFARDIAAALAVEFTFVTVVGVLAVVQGLRMIRERRSVEVVRAALEDPELRYEAPVPGDDLDTDIANATGWSIHSQNRRSRLRKRMAETATATVASVENVSHAEARERVRRGSWTDDRVAAGFLGEQRGYPLDEHARRLARGESQFSFGARRTAAALLALQEGER